MWFGSGRAETGIMRTEIGVARIKISIERTENGPEHPRGGTVDWSWHLTLHLAPQIGPWS